jgi:two-component system sensor histidine kinase DesK
VAASALGIAVFLPLYLRSFGHSDARALHSGLAVAALGAALHPFGGVWAVFVVYACGLLGGVLPRRRAGAALAGVALALTALVVWRSLPMVEWLPALFFGAMTTMVSMYSAAYAAQSLALAASRDEARRLAVVAERERIARDLHDLLGHTLTAVAVKADLAGRLIDANPARAKAEIEEIRRTARDALADVRAAVTGMRSTRLAHELAAARRALEGAGIALNTQGVAPPLPPALETALGFVLLEAVTNVVRHARAECCEIAFERQADTVLLRIRDTRAAAASLASPSPTPLPPPAEGHGLSGMRQRLAALGGTLSLERTPAGSTLLARLPLVPAGPGAPA